MGNHIYIPHMFLITIISFCLLTTILPQSHSQQPPPNNFTVCSNPFNCGLVSKIYFPFWGDDRPDYCGGGSDFRLHCYDHQIPSIQIGSQNLRVFYIDNKNYTMGLRMFLDDEPDPCGPILKEAVDAINHSQNFRYPDPEGMHNITIFYRCPTGTPLGDNNHMCPYDVDPMIAFYDDVKEALYHESSHLSDCHENITVPELQGTRLPPKGGFDALQEALSKGFEANYWVPYAQECMTCLESGGACGTNDTFKFTCHCPDGWSDASNCTGHIHIHKQSSKGSFPVPKKKGHHPLIWKALGIGVGAAVFVALAAIIAIYCYRRRKKTADYEVSYVQSRSLTSDPSSVIRDTEKGVSQYFGVPLFTYTELEEATNHFDSSRELGDGGFGTVYFGKLQDGRCVAVKRLYENNYRRVEQFRNEIQLLAGLRHPNLVSLYGCTSRHSRELLLVYEYISNGTVADHLHGERARAGTLPWHIRMKIAVETATALMYLHAKDIIHRDVKTNNILLDSHFVVKVADFGLSRLFPNNVTHISTAPQGTPGYVDPEYHECYQLTDKSDVYSFGVVLIELISSLPAVDITRHRHEINLSNMAINKIQNQALHELVDRDIGFESDFKVRKMVNAVAELAFQCLQSSKDMRPSMGEVVDTLKDIQSDGKHKSQPEVMDITGDDVVLLKDDPPPPSPDSNAVSKSTTPNASG